MRISGIQIDRFGIWSGVNFENLSEGVNVFYGPNEAGKTTLMQFIRMVLYGFGGNRAERYLQNAGYGMLAAGQRIGGSVAIVARDDEYHVRRYAAQTNPMEDLEGELRVTARDGSRQGGHRLSTVLAGIDEQIFNNVYAVGLREMQYLATLNDTQASRYLYNLSTGTDRVSLVDVMRQLQATRRGLVAGGDQPALLEVLSEQRDQYVADVGQFAGSVEQWTQWKSELDHVEEELSRIEAGRAAQVRRAQVLERADRLQPIWERRQALESELERLGHVPAVSNETQARLLELRRKTEACQARLEEVNSQQSPEQQPGGRRPLDEEALMRNAIRIDALLDEKPAIIELDGRLRELQRRLEETELEVQVELERLGLVTATDSAPQIDDQSLSLLREPARQVERDRELLEQAKQDSARLRVEAEKIGEELTATLGRDPDLALRLDGKQLDESHDTGRLAKRLRRRMALDSKLNELRQRLESMNERRKALLRSQLLPWDVVRALGALFALGMTLLLVALFAEYFGITGPSRAGFAVMGVIGVAAAALLKMLLDGSGRDELLALQEQADKLQSELADSEAEAERLERKIPGPRTGPFRVGEARKRLTRLEALLPMDSRRRAMLESGKKYEQAAIDIANRMKRSREKWSEALNTAGLSDRLQPSQILQISDDSARLATLNRECETIREQIADTQRELDVFAERAAALLTEIGRRPVALRVTEMMGELTASMQLHDQQREMAEQRLEQQRKTRHRQQELSRELRQFQSEHRALVAAHGAVDDDDLQRLIERRAKWEQLTADIQSRSDEIQAILGEAKNERAILSELFGKSQQPLAKRIKQAAAERERTEERHKELLERRGELLERRRTIRDDRRLSNALMNVGTVDAQLEQGIEQARIIGAMTSLLRTVYKRYESDRQPESLKQASTHLRRMTAGKYTRIWTPLDEDMLYVDDPSRLSIPVDQLSRGTREQLFLALRLALISDYARRGVRVPVVLDDVLVNFDVQRTRAAAEVLVEFAAAGHQILIFSCHQHVMDIFGELGVDVRALPTQSGDVPPMPAPVVTAEPNQEAPDELPLMDVSMDERRLPRSMPRPMVGPTATDELVIGYQDDAQSDWLFGFDQPVAAAHEEDAWADEPHQVDFDADLDEDLDFDDSNDDDRQPATLQDTWEDERWSSEPTHSESSAPRTATPQPIADWADDEVRDRPVKLVRSPVIASAVSTASTATESTLQSKSSLADTLVSGDLRRPKKKTRKFQADSPQTQPLELYPPERPPHETSTLESPDSIEWPNAKDADANSEPGQSNASLRLTAGSSPDFSPLEQLDVVDLPTEDVGNDVADATSSDADEEFEYEYVDEDEPTESLAEGEYADLGEDLTLSTGRPEPLGVEIDESEFDDSTANVADDRVIAEADDEMNTTQVEDDEETEYEYVEEEYEDEEEGHVSGEEDEDPAYADAEAIETHADDVNADEQDSGEQALDGAEEEYYEEDEEDYEIEYEYVDDDTDDTDDADEEDLA